MKQVYGVWDNGIKFLICVNYPTKEAAQKSIDDLLTHYPNSSYSIVPLTYEEPTENLNILELQPDPTNELTPFITENI